MLPPLANLFAFSSLRRDLISEVAADLASIGAFAKVWRPHERWVVAEAPLPHSPYPSPVVRLGGLVFVEGRDRVLRPGHEADDVVRLHELLDRAPAALSQLLGDFGFVSFRPDGSAVTVRSCGGRVPLYVWADDESVAIATLQRDLAAFLPGEVDIDPLGHAAWTTQAAFTPEDRTLVAGARLLPAGCHITSSAGSSSPFVRYWDPRPGECHRSGSVGIDEAAGNLRDLLVAHLGEELHPDGGNFLSLSGGVDSSSLAALAVRAASRPISATLSIVPPDDPRRAWELGYIEPLLEEIGGVAERYLQNGDLGAIDRLYRATAPSLVPTIHPVLCRLPQLATEIDITTYVGGEYCDDLFGVLLLDDWNEAVTPWLAAARTGDAPHGRASVLRWARERALALIGNPRVRSLPRRLPEFVLSGLQAEYEGWRRRRRRLLGADHLPWRHTWGRRDLGLGWIEMNWEITSPLGVRRVLPFVTREIIELAMSCHPADVLADGPKTLLRRGLAADVPQRNLFRPDKGLWGRGTARPHVDMPRSVPDGAWKVVDERWIESAARTAAPEVAWPISHLIESCMEFQRLRAERDVRIMRGAEAAHEGT